jgi:hypothetical protein
MSTHTKEGIYLLKNETESIGICDKTSISALVCFTDEKFVSPLHSFPSLRIEQYFMEVFDCTIR